LPQTSTNFCDLDLDAALKPIKSALGTMYQYSCGYVPRIKHADLLRLSKKTIVDQAVPWILSVWEEDIAVTLLATLGVCRNRMPDKNARITRFRVT